MDIFDGVQTSINDKRIYRHITLANKLEVLLIHDIETEKCSAACDVKVGSMSDPQNVPIKLYVLWHIF